MGMPDTLDRTVALLRFLKETATLRRKRVAAYGSGDTVLWFHELPRGLSSQWGDACRSVFLDDKPDGMPDLWLEVRKRLPPKFPPVPSELRDWVPQDFQNRPEEFAHRCPDELISLLRRQITVVQNKRTVDSDALPDQASAVHEEVAAERRLQDHPWVETAWQTYLSDHWEPWAQNWRVWEKVQEVYARIDFMRRRLEESEERYELLLAVGLLQWRDSTGTTVARHLLTAPADVSLDAARGILTIVPAASFERFRIELDMLELQDQPQLTDADLTERLEDLDVRAWDTASIMAILRIIANKTRSDAQVDEAWEPLARADETLRILYAPAVVLRERRPTAYENLVDGLIKACEAESEWSTTAPWERFVGEGGVPSDSAEGDNHTNTVRRIADTRLYFPLPTNEEQRAIAERLGRRPYVLVKGPPGTGKSHTIANLICHLLASGERVLVTAFAPKALSVLRDLLPGDIRNLCVTAFGSSREDHRRLEDSVRGILARKNSWRGK